MDSRTQWLRIYRAWRSAGRPDGRELFAVICGDMGRPDGWSSSFPPVPALAMQRCLSDMLRPSVPIATELATTVLNGFGSHNPWRAPAMNSPRFESWRRVARRGCNLRSRLLERGALTLDAGNWVRAVAL